MNKMIYRKHFLWLTIVYSVFSTPLFAHTLTISCPHDDISLKVELAETPREQAKGLMFRKHLEKDAGMLFLYPTPSPLAMWMKNTPLSLDMVFGDEAGKILAIHENTIPYSLQIIGPVEGATQVLEIVGGSVQKHDITKSCMLTLDR